MSVVVYAPFFDDGAGFVECHELVLVQALVEEAAIKTFDVSGADHELLERNIFNREQMTLINPQDPKGYVKDVTPP